MIKIGFILFNVYSKSTEIKPLCIANEELTFVEKAFFGINFIVKLIIILFVCQDM